jgi:O-antigen/teichoic acid export membrane protein
VGLAVLHRLSWGVADQAVSSLSNFALGIAVARALDSARFGAFTLVIVTFGVVLNASRGLSTDPLVVRFSGRPDEEWRRAVAAASATATLVGVVAGLLCIAAHPLLPTAVGQGFLVLGFLLPGLMLQDSWRFALFAVGRSSMAFINDVAWTVLQLSAVLALLLTGKATVVTCLLAFGLTAAAAAAFGFWQLRIVPDFRAVPAWLAAHRDLGSRYLVENVSISGARQFRMFALGAFAGLSAVGEVRAAEMLMGPFLVILMGVSQVAVPEASHVLNTRPRMLRRFCLVLGAVQASAALLWGVAIMVLLSSGAGEALLGQLWSPARALLPAVMIHFTVLAFETGAAAGVRALGASRRSLRAQLSNAGLSVVFGTIGAKVDGASGMCWGVALGATLGAIIWWVQLRRALSAHLNTPVEPVLNKGE